MGLYFFIENDKIKKTYNGLVSYKVTLLGVTLPKLKSYIVFQHIDHVRQYYFLNFSRIYVLIL